MAFSKFCYRSLSSDDDNALQSFFSQNDSERTSPKERAAVFALYRAVKDKDLKYSEMLREKDVMLSKKDVMLSNKDAELSKVIADNKVYTLKSNVIMEKLFRESYSFTARGLLEYWDVEILSKLPGKTRHDRWLSFITIHSNGPALLACVKQKIPIIRNAESFARHMEGITAVTSFPHHASAFDIKSGNAVCIASSLPPQTQDILRCLCENSDPFPVRFQEINVSDLSHLYEKL